MRDTVTYYGVNVGIRRFSTQVDHNIDITWKDAQLLIDTGQYIPYEGYKGKQLGNYTYALTQDKTILLVWSQRSGRYYGVAKRK